jgi:outer membrane protein assembly factor BamB
MTRPALKTAALLCLLLAGTAAPLPAREQKTVFHGMPVEPETEFERGASAKPVSFERAWTFEGFAAPIAGDPVAAGPGVIATDRSGQVALIDASTGKPVWRVSVGETATIGAFADGTGVYQGTGPGTLVALESADGVERWRAPLEGTPLAPPIAAAGRLFVVTETPEILAVDPADGAVLGRRPLPGRPLPPVAWEGRIVVGTDHGMLVSFDAGTLETVWRRYLRHAITAPPAIVGKRLFVATADRALWALKAKSGGVVWRQRTGSIVTARPVAVEDYVYVPCWDNDVYALKRRNGHLMGRARLDHRLSGETAWQSGHLFIAPFTEGTLVALALPYLGVAGRHELGVPGEWFTTAPVAAPGALTVGWGRDLGRLLALRVIEAREPSPAPGAPPGPGGAPPAVPSAPVTPGI